MAGVRIRLAVTAAAAFAVAGAAQPLARDVLVLARVKQHVSEHLKRLPDYTCTETVRRYARRAGQAEPLLRDTVRFEVAHAGGKELFAWPGAARFGPDHPAALVREGLTSSGDFGQRLALVFENPSVSFRFAGEEVIEGRNAFRYNFAVPIFSSGWKLRLGDGAVRMIGGKGSFWADPNTFTLLRLELYGTELPPDIPVQKITSIIDYGDAGQGSAIGWLPVMADVQLTSPAAEYRNVTKFSSCRQYRSESAISFSEPGLDPAASRPARLPGSRRLTNLGTGPAVTRAVVAPLPPGLTLVVQLTTALEDDSIVGEPVTARLARDVKTANRMLRANAVVRGRLRALQRYDTPRDFYVVALEFNSVETSSSIAPLAVSLVRTGRHPGISRKLKVSSEQQVTVMGDPLKGNVPVSWEERVKSLAMADEPGLVTFFVEGKRFKLEPGFVLTLKTVPVTATDRE